MPSYRPSCSSAPAPCAACCCCPEPQSGPESRPSVPPAAGLWALHTTATPPPLWARPGPTPSEAVRPGGPSPLRSQGQQLATNTLLLTQTKTSFLEHSGSQSVVHGPPVGHWRPLVVRECLWVKWWLVWKTNPAGTPTRAGSLTGAGSLTRAGSLTVDLPDVDHLLHGTSQILPSEAPSQRGQAGVAGGTQTSQALI